jgi:transposase
MTRAMDPEVADAVWAAIEPILPIPVDEHSLGCHNPRVPDRVCFRGILIRLVTGSSWVDIEAIMNFEVSDTTLRTPRDEWIAAGVFDQRETEARTGYDRILELDLGVVAIDGSLHKAPCGGEGTGNSPVDRAKLGWKWSVAVDTHGIPLGWVIDGANRNDIRLLEPTLDAVAANGLLDDIETLSLDRGYDYPIVRTRLASYGLTISTSNGAARNRRQAPRTGSRSGCAGSSRRPTPGGRTTGNSDDPPTAKCAIDTPRSNSPPPC